MSRSASRRLLANTMELRCVSIRSTMRSSTSGQMELFSRFAMSGTGTCTLRSNVLAAGGATMVVGAAPAWLPDRKRAISSGGRTVADRPMRCAGVASMASRRSSDSARCAPRLVPATACTSSTMTVCTVASVSRAAEVSIRNSDSGVVMRMSGGLADQLAAPIGWGVAGPHADADVRRRLAPSLGYPGDARQRCAQVALDVDSQRLERGDVEHPGARRGGFPGLSRPAGRWPTGTRPVSCPTRWGR